MRRFFVIFILLQLVLFGLELLQPVQQYVVVPFTSALADLCSTLVKTFDTNVIAQGKVLQDRVTGFGVSIEPGCNGIEACIVLLSAIVAYPATWAYRIKGLVIGFIAIQALNIVRIISLFYLGQWHMGWFSFAHTYLWSALIMLDVLVVFMIWVQRNPGNKRPENPTPPPQETGEDQRRKEESISRQTTIQSPSAAELGHATGGHPRN